MHKTSIAVTTTLLIVPTALSAGRLDYGTRTQALWTDNVLGVPENEQDDVSGRLSPWAELLDDDGDLTGGLRYAPSYEYYLDQDGLRGFDHDANGHLEWQMTPSTKFAVSDRFQRYHTVTRFNSEVAPGETINQIGDRERFKRNIVNASLDHHLNPRDLLSLYAYHNLLDFSEENQPDRDNFGSGLYYQHRLSERSTLGSRLSWSRQVFNSNQRDKINTDYLNLSGVVTHEFTRTFRVELSAGPTLIFGDSQEFQDADPATPEIDIQRNVFPAQRQQDGRIHFFDANTCKDKDKVTGLPILDFTCGDGGSTNILTFNNREIAPIIGSIPSANDTNTTYFAELSLVKEWEKWQADLTYTRSISQATSVAAVSDLVYASLRWEPAPRWSATLSAGYERQEQATDNVVLVTTVTNENLPPPNPPTLPNCCANSQETRAEILDNSSRIENYTASLFVSYQLTRRSTLFATAWWGEQKQTGDISFLGDVQTFTATIGVNYTFDPFLF